MTRLPVDYIERTRDQYSALGYPAYRWVEEKEPPAFTRVEAPMHEWRVGLVASGAFTCRARLRSIIGTTSAIGRSTQTRAPTGCG